MAVFFGVVTDVGRAKLAASMLPGGQKIELPIMSIGDGAGVKVTPSSEQTALVREVYRAATNKIIISSTDPEVLIGELVVPIAEGGFVVREYGLWDADGDLFAVGNFPSSYKPLPEEGATQDMVIRGHVKFSEVAQVQLKIDPSVVIASRQWVIDSFLPITHGVVGQFLRMRSNVLGDVEWVDLDLEGINILFDTKTEVQELADTQTIINWNTITTNNTGFYIDGQRLFPDDDYEITGDTQITLTTGASTGQKILGVQNDQTAGINDATEALRGLARFANDAAVLAGLSRVLAVSPATLKLALSEAGFLKKASNLADLTDATEARNNLGLKGGATADLGTATGDVLPHDAYGLGGHGTQLTQANNLNNIRAFGWYRWGSAASAPANSPLSAAGIMLVEPYSTSSQWAKQTVVTLGGAATIRRFWRLLPNNVNEGAVWREDLDSGVAGEAGLALFKAATAPEARAAINAVGKGENGLLAPVVIADTANLNNFKNHGWYYHSTPRPTNAPLNEAGYLDVTPWGTGSERVRQVWTSATSGREFVRIITESSGGVWQERSFRADTFFLQRLNNLSDIPNKPAALVNLGLTPFLPKAIALFAGRQIVGEGARLYFNCSIPAGSNVMTMTRVVSGFGGLASMTPAAPDDDALGVRPATAGIFGPPQPGYGGAAVGSFIAGHRIHIQRWNGNVPSPLNVKISTATVTIAEYTGAATTTLTVPVTSSGSARSGLCYIPLCFKKGSRNVETVVRIGIGRYFINLAASAFSQSANATRYILPAAPRTAYSGSDTFVTTLDHAPEAGDAMERESACLRVERLNDSLQDAILAGAHFFEQE